MKIYNIIISIIFFCLSVGIFYNTKQFSKIKFGTLGSGQWPRFVALIMGALAITLLLQTLFSKPKSDETKEEPIKFKSGGIRRVFILFFVLAAYALLMPILGFIIDSFLFIIAVMIVMGERRLFNLLGISFGLTIGIYFIFQYLLKLMLPRPVFF